MRHENLADVNSAGGAVEVVRQFVELSNPQFQFVDTFFSVLLCP